MGRRRCYHISEGAEKPTKLDQAYQLQTDELLLLQRTPLPLSMKQRPPTAMYPAIAVAAIVAGALAPAGAYGFMASPTALGVVRPYAGKATTTMMSSAARPLPGASMCCTGPSILLFSREGGSSSFCCFANRIGSCVMFFSCF